MNPASVRQHAASPCLYINTRPVPGLFSSQSLRQTSSAATGSLATSCDGRDHYSSEHATISITTVIIFFIIISCCNSARRNQRISGGCHHNARMTTSSTENRPTLIFYTTIYKKSLPIYKSGNKNRSNLHWCFGIKNSPGVYYCQQLTLSVCLSVRLSVCHQKNFILLLFLFLDGIEPFLAISSLLPHLQTVVLRFLI